MDANAIAVRHPHTFCKPDAETVDRVTAGGSVKSIFAFDTNNLDAPRAERLWVTVEDIETDGAFSGRLDNYPQYICDLSLDERIVFETRHIINTEYDPRETPISRYIRRCFITCRVINEGKVVGYFYHEAPEEENDSGWRLMAGDKSDDYMNITETTVYASLGSMLNTDDSTLSLLDVPPGRAFERLTGGSFIEVQGSEG